MTNTGGNWTPDFYKVVLHEIGHAIGLNHETANLAIMNPTVTANDLQPDDISGIQTAYGVQDFGPNIFHMPASLANITILDGARLTHDKWQRARKYDKRVLG